MVEEVEQEVNHPHKKAHWRILIAIIILVAGFFVYQIYSLEHLKLNNKTYFRTNTVQLKTDLKKSFDQLEIGLYYKDELYKTVHPKDLGIDLDSGTTIDRLWFERQLNAENIFKHISKDSAILDDFKVKINREKLIKYLDKNFSIQGQKVKNPTFYYDKKVNIFKYKPGVNGYSVDIDKMLENDLVLSLSQPNKLEIIVNKIEPKISDKNAAMALEQVNKRLKIRINLNNNGRLIYFPDPWDIAEWVIFQPQVDGRIELDYDKNKIKQFLNKKVVKWTKVKPVDKVTLVDDNGQIIQIISQGRVGYDAFDLDKVVDIIYQAIKDGRAIDQELAMVKVPFKERKIIANGDNWIDVNLSRQTATMYNGSTPLQTFVISSGIARFPTPVGTHYVWHKTRVQRMTGGSKKDGTYYNMPNVHWNTFFTYSGAGFHEAYWHNNFGRPMSHGCINMRLADAKTIYDFAPIGTKVVVHY